MRERSGPPDRAEEPDLAQLPELLAVYARVWGTPMSTADQRGCFHTLLDLLCLPTGTWQLAARRAVLTTGELRAET